MSHCREAKYIHVGDNIIALLTTFFSNSEIGYLYTDTPNLSGKHTHTHIHTYFYICLCLHKFTNVQIKVGKNSIQIHIEISN